MAPGSFAARAIVYVGFIATGIASVATELLLEWLFRGSLFRYSINLIPIGALLLGIVGVSGGIWLARVLQVRLGILDLMGMLGIAAGTVLGVYIIPYLTTTTQRGAHLSGLMSFGDFLPLAITHTHIQMNGNDVGVAGPWKGYALFALQVVGCCAAYVGGYCLLRDIPRCDRCNRYLDVVGTRRIGPFPPAAANELLTRARKASWTQYAAVINDWHSVDLPNKVVQARIMLALRQCEGCLRQHLSEKVQIGDGKKWQLQSNATRRVFLPAGTSIRNAV